MGTDISFRFLHKISLMRFTSFWKAHLDRMSSDWLIHGFTVKGLLRCLYKYVKVILYSYLILKKMNERITDS